VKLPIRVRLTAWYVVLLALVIAGLGFFVVTRLRTDLVGHADTSLRTVRISARPNGRSSFLRR